MTNKIAKKNIAFFDFDGTISSGDSLWLFITHIVGKKRLILGVARHIHILLGYTLGLISNTDAKQALSAKFLSGISTDDFAKHCIDFLPTLESICKASALSTIAWHKERGDIIVVVSASFEEYLAPLCEKLGIGLIATKLEVLGNSLSGRFGSPNCYGAQKVERIKQQYDLSEYGEIYVYGDSKGDKEMLAIASDEKHRFYRYFK
ncbi:HAD-IB family hydrolase [Helicobacter sp. MIT 01-3238]|uniref:HAD-IB family hydrolase n=1 Tax=Helicobacter sp. MIT 01-3238 TaxID=398627 RepID=UPI000E1F2703|nr:HAD-IB family hydrolase [Helicobacter sp. MIT 01-3238]RDU53226.1 HAD-IB family hydrolase [Helicobacter sp. MIT 01-3238]